MYTICRQLIAHGKLEGEIEDARRAERRFTREAGVLARQYYQCVDQPHLIWANTQWTSEGDHNRLARELMKVRDDDRVASAYFRPGLYFEVFAEEVVDAAWERMPRRRAGHVIIAHAIVSDREAETWMSSLVARVQRLHPPVGLCSCRTFLNAYCKQELICFLGWEDVAAYERGRMDSDRTIEEVLLVGDRPYELASFVQYECVPLSMGGGHDANGGD